MSGEQLNWLLDGYDAMRLKQYDRLHFSSVLQGALPAHLVRCQRMPIALNQLPDDIDTLKSRVAEQVASQ